MRPEIADLVAPLLALSHWLGPMAYTTACTTVQAMTRVLLKCEYILRVEAICTPRNLDFET